MTIVNLLRQLVCTMSSINLVKAHVCQHTRGVANGNYRLCFGITGNCSTAKAWIWLWSEKEELVIANLSQDRMIEVIKINKPPPHLPVTRRPPLFKYSTPVWSRSGCFRFSKFRMSSMDSESIGRVRQGLPSRVLNY